ncbi:MAG TPA: peptidase M4 [Marinobacter sp.]|nr:peptidase M4 [Marinobacter sp.]
MNKRLRLLLLCSALTVTAIPAFASGDIETDEPSISQAKISLQEAIQVAEQHSGGKASRAEFEQTANGPAFDVEITKGKQTLDVRVDPMTSKVLSSEMDREDNDQSSDPID